MNLSLETQDLRSFRDLSLWFFPQDFTLFQRLHARYTCGKVIGSIIRIVRKEQRQWRNQISQKSLNILQNRPLSNVCISQGLGSVSHISELFQSQDKKIEMFFMKSHQTYLMYQDSSCIFTMPKLPITKAQSPTYPHKKKQIKYVQFLNIQKYLHFCTAYCLDVEVARQSFISWKFIRPGHQVLQLGYTRKFHAMKLSLSRRQKKDGNVWERD